MTDPRFQFARGEDELRALRAIAKRIDPQLPGLFAELPRLPYGIRAMQPEEGDNPPHYTPGAIDGSRPGWFEANANNLAGQPSWTLESLFLHEAVPGHHLQIARAQELQGLPKIRRSYSNAGFEEGWALYSESLGKQFGLYTDPRTRFGRLSDEALRAARLVVEYYWKSEPDFSRVNRAVSKAGGFPPSESLDWSRVRKRLVGTWSL